jgi:hypothetical protein
MRLVCHACCFRIEVEFFAPKTIFRRYEGVPRQARFEIERRLRRRVAQELRRRVASGLEDSK